MKQESILDPMSILAHLGSKYEDYQWMYHNLSTPKIALDALCSAYGVLGREMYQEMVSVEGERRSENAPMESGKEGEI